MKLIDLAHKRRRIVVYLKRLQVLIDAFKSRVSTDSGTFEGESNLKKQLQFIQNLFTSLVVLTPNAWKVSKLYTILQNDGTTDFDFVRATGATRVNESGLIESLGNNIPRIDWLNGKPQILIEEQRTNLLLRSQEFDNAIWTKDNCTVTANNTIAPDGTMTADKIVEGATTAFKRIRVDAVYGTSTHGFSFFAKKAERRYLFVRSRDAGTFRNIAFDLEDGVKTFEETGAFVGNIIPFPNDWFRIDIVGEGISSSQALSIFLSDTPTPGGGAYAYTGDGSSGLFLWGAMLEVGSAASSYIPTTTATVTRNADVATLDPPTGTTEIIETVNGVENIITSIPTTYQLPEGRIDKILMK
jgi:hypothetical protein